MRKLGYTFFLVMIKLEYSFIWETLSIIVSELILQLIMDIVSIKDGHIGTLKYECFNLHIFYIKLFIHSFKNEQW